MLLRFSVIVLALGAPFVAYWLHAALTRQKTGPGVGARHALPVPHLLLIGAASAAVCLAVMAFDQRGTAGQKFVPSQLENGVLQPGHFEKTAP